MDNFTYKLLRLAKTALRFLLFAPVWLLELSLGLFDSSLEAKTLRVRCSIGVLNFSANLLIYKKCCEI
jgi:hypothetical protein